MNGKTLRLTPPEKRLAVKPPFSFGTRSLYRLSLILTITALCLQLLISPTLENIFAATTTSITSCATFAYLFGRRRAFLRTPLSALSILGLNISTQSGALLYQSFSWTALEFNLQNPIGTFFYIGLLQLTLLLSHFIYSSSYTFSRIRNALSERVLVPLRLFAVPSHRQLWTMGLIGVAAMWFSATSMKDAQYGDTSAKFLVALIPFCYAPLLVPFLRNLYPSVYLRKTSYLPFVGYILLLVALSLARNSRATFAVAFITIGLTFLILLIDGHIRVTRRQIIRALAISVPAAFLLGVISDLALAMVIVRSQRDEVIGWDLIRLSLDTFYDDDALSAYKESIKYFLLEDYNESYISNPMFARLVTIKFDDNMFHYFDLFNSEKANALLTVTLEKVWALLPTPFIIISDLGIDKSNLEFSIGDYIHYLVVGSGLGGYRTGSITAHGLIIFGFWFYLILLFAAPFLFVVNDAFRRRKGATWTISPLILIGIYPLFSQFNGDSLLVQIGYLVRGLPQFIFLYVLIMILLSPLRPTTRSIRAI